MIGNLFNKKNTENDAYLRQSELQNSLDLEVKNPEIPTETKARVDNNDPSQLGLQIDDGKIHKVSKIRENVRKWENIIEVIPFWRMAINPINITISIITVIATVFIVFSQANLLPDEIAIFYSHIDNTRVNIDKSFFLLLPVIIAIFEVVLIRLKRIIFNFDRRLSGVMAVSQSFFNITLIIALIEIITLVIA